MQNREWKYIIVYREVKTVFYFPIPQDELYTYILCVLLIKTPRARNIISAYDVKVSAYNEVVSECSDKVQRTSTFAILARNVEVSAEKEVSS